MFKIKDRIGNSHYYISIVFNPHNRDFMSVSSVRGILELATCLLIARFFYKRLGISAPEAGFNKKFRYWYICHRGVCERKHGFDVVEKLRWEIEPDPILSS